MGIEHNTVVISYGLPAAGREAFAGELLMSRVAHLEKCKKSGKIDSWENLIMAPHGGDPAGLFIIRGAHQNLIWLLDDTEFQELNMRAIYCLTNYAVLSAFGGPLVPEVMKMWAKAMPHRE
jgi:hypothetical protein